MHRKTLMAWTAVWALTLAACSGNPDTMLSPSGVAPSPAALNPDGSSLKVTAPTDLGPSGSVVVGSNRPTLSFTNATGRYAGVGFAYEIEVVNANGTVVYSRVIGESGTSSSHALEADLSYADNFWWRVRARLGAQAGPWSDYAAFRTPDPPTPVAPTGGGSAGSLPFPIPAECGPFGNGNRFACAAAVAALSVEWQRCRGGNGLGCHRFTRQVGWALAQSDPNWSLIQAQPGGHACNCNSCGASDGTMFREDTVVYAGRSVYDMITGAGGPSPSLTWTSVPGPRAGDSPILPPLCP